MHAAHQAARAWSLRVANAAAGSGASSSAARSVEERSRVGRFEETLAVVRALLAGERVTHRGRYYTLENASVRAGFLLAVLGGLAMMRRAGEFRVQVLLRVGLLLLFWFDVFTHMPRLQPSVQPVAYEPGVMRAFFNENFKLRDPQLTPGESRAMRSRSHSIIR